MGSILIITGGAFAIVLALILLQVVIVVLAVCKYFFFSKRHKQIDTNHLPPITVLIPTYNESVRTTITSILNDPYPHKQIIVIDDGSSIPITVPRGVLYKKQKHQGKVTALNFGRSLASHDIIVTVDADTRVNNSLREIVEPLLQDASVGAVSACCVPLTRSPLGWFQYVEYSYLNMIRRALSSISGASVWFFGFYVAYRASALNAVGGFSKQTTTEDMDITLTLLTKKYKVLTSSATGYTYTPATVSAYLRQRKRWWVGGLQNIRKHTEFAFSRRLAALFLTTNQIWWTIFAFVSFPFIAYQYWFWFSESIWYTIRWFSAMGPPYVLYKIPEWGVSIGIFGVLAGIFTTLLLLSAVTITLTKERGGFWHSSFRIVTSLIAIMFYFPYTLLHNVAIIRGVFSYLKNKRQLFVS